jgi:hypothetical protein
MGTEATVRDVAALAGAAEHRMPSTFVCGLLIFAAKMALRIRGFGWTVRWIRRHVEATAASASVDTSVVKAAEHAVAMAGALYPGRALCLEQSFVLYYLLRRQGVEVQYCQGVQAHPFVAHAWIEYRGQPINDVAEHVTHFALLPAQLP